MSVRVMTAVWALPLPDSEKIVLLALADCANDEGHCWPSMRTLSIKCSKTDRTVQAAIKSLCSAGHLTRREVLGKGCNYTVHPRSDCTPEVTSPPKRTTQTPEAASDKPSKNRNIVDASASTQASVRGKHKIPKDWELPPIANLPPRARQLAEQWPAGAYAAHGEAFVSYWRGCGRMMTDWADTWANRLVALHSQVMRDAKSGIGFGPANDAAPAPREQYEAVCDREIERYRRQGNEREALVWEAKKRGEERRNGATGPPRSLGALTAGIRQQMSH